MANTAAFTNMRALMTGLAKTMNLVNPEVERHHEQTAYLSLFLAREMGLPEEDAVLALYAALLHDIGSIIVEEPQSVAEVESNAIEVSKAGASMLADLPGFADIASTISYCQCGWRGTVARAILEKPGKLTAEELNVVKEHPYYTALVLLDIDGFDAIGHWAANHHEKLTGRGYPFHRGYGELDTGDRIMAVADIFSAITEERPYRAGMTREAAAGVLMEDARAGAVCGDVAALLIEHYDEVDAARDAASRKAGKRYFDSLKRTAD